MRNIKKGSKNKLVANKAKKKKHKHKIIHVVGTVDYVNPAYAYIIVEGYEKDILVKSQDLLFALHKDKVKVAITSPGKSTNDYPIGHVVKILERPIQQFVGTFYTKQSKHYVLPNNKRMHSRILIAPEDAAGAVNNNRVVVQLLSGPTALQPLAGKVIRVLGTTGEHEAEIHTIIAEFNLPTAFNDPVMTATHAIPSEIPAAEVQRRKDYRTVFTVTIDPEDAKDFDDALSLQQLAHGHMEVGVHIADVSHYVQPGSEIDAEALERGTSVYLVDRTIPMLPERLSNDLCSLKPMQDRLAFSAIFEFDAAGNIQQEWFGETIIHSNQRLTYEEAQQAITDTNNPLHTPLHTLHTLAQSLRTKRFQHGSINFDTPSVKFKIDVHGNIVDCFTKVSQDSHKLIEEFMLLANQRVATFVKQLKHGNKPPTFVYRIHDNPDSDKVNEFFDFAKQFGYAIDTDVKKIASSINHLTESLANKPEAHIIQTLAIRAMAKACYTTEAKPHFGLAFKHYTHFTSPIRRYPDLLVHRLLKGYLQGHKPAAPRTDYEKQCQYASEREKIAADAERASIKYMQVKLMQTLGTQNLQGIISYITTWGIYVDLLDFFCDGMIRLADLKDDYYVLDKTGFKLVGRRTKKTYKLGDIVQVTIKGCDISKRTVDLLFPTA